MLKIYKSFDSKKLKIVIFFKNLFFRNNVFIKQINMTTKKYNDALQVSKSKCSCLSLTGLIILLSTIIITFLAYFYFIGTGMSIEMNYYALPMHLKMRYSLEQMREFAYKNSISQNFRLSLYQRWNLSFNRILEISENR